MKLLKRIDDFFFKPTSVATIGIFRIFFGIVIFLSFLGRYPYRELFYGENGLVRAATTAQFFPGHWLLYFRFVPAGDPGLNYFFLILLLAIIFLIIGLFTRVNSIIVFLGVVALSNRNFFVDNAGDDLLRINCFLLIFSQAGTAYSVDRWLRIKRGLESKSVVPLSAPWAQRLLQIQLAYLYLNTFILKLPGEGWQNGTALYYALNYVELQRFDFKYLFYYLWQIKAATYSVMVGEIALATLVWYRPLRYWVLSVGVLLHIGINLTMQFPIFQYVMITSLINFVYPEDMERIMSKLKQGVLHGKFKRRFKST